MEKWEKSGDLLGEVGCGKLLGLGEGVGGDLEGNLGVYFGVSF